MKIDDDTIRKYIVEHKDSSVVPGLKWDALVPEEGESIRKGDFDEWYNIVKGNVEDKMFGEAFNTPFNFGSRQRNDQSVEFDKTYYDLEVTRTRVVMFTPALSSMFMFIPDKLGFYREVIDSTLDVFDISDHIMTPMTEGGEVYGAASSALNGNEDVTICLGDDVNIFKKGKQYAYDGVNWETQVGTILGAPFYGTKTFFGGLPHVPSGVFDTSLDDTLASLWVYATSESMNKGEDIKGIMERELKDEQCNFMLGLAYAYDRDYPRLQGLKLAQDKSGVDVPLPYGRTLELFNKSTEDEAERWYLGYHGTDQKGGSLLDFLQKIKPEDFRGGEMSEYIADGPPPQKAV